MSRKVAPVFLLIGERPSCAAILRKNTLHSLLLQTETPCRVYYHKQLTHNDITNPSQHSGNYVYRQVLEIKPPHFTGTVFVLLFFR